MKTCYSIDKNITFMINQIKRDDGKNIYPYMATHSRKSHLA